MLLITTPDVASRALVTKIYPVGDLLAAHEGKAQAEGFKAPDAGDSFDDPAQLVVDRGRAGRPRLRA